MTKFETFVKQDNTVAKVTTKAANIVLARQALEKQYGAGSLVAGIKAIA